MTLITDRPSLAFTARTALSYVVAPGAYAGGVPPVPLTPADYEDIQIAYERADRTDQAAEIHSRRAPWGDPDRELAAQEAVHELASVLTRVLNAAGHPGTVAADHLSELI